MKKLIVIFTVVLSAAVIAFVGCKKTSTEVVKNFNTESFIPDRSYEALHEADNPEMVEYYTEYFLSDSSMALVFDKFMYNSVRMRGAVLTNGGNNALEEWDDLIFNYTSYGQVEEFYLNYSIDTTDMIDMHSEILASWLNLLVKNPNFNDLTMNDQALVINNLQATLTSEFETEYPENILVKTIRNIINLDPNAQSRGITLAEAVGCIGSAIVGQIAGGVDVIKQLVSVINGYNLGWSGIVSVVKSALTSVLTSNLAGMAINFAFCMAWAYFF